MKKKKKLKINCFYKAYGGPAHPAQIFAFDKKHKTYISIKFGTSKGNHMTEIHPIQSGYLRAFVHNRPFEGTVDDYDDKELLGLCIDFRDFGIIEIIKHKKPNRSRRAKLRYKK